MVRFSNCPGLMLTQNNTYAKLVGYCYFLFAFTPNQLIIVTIFHFIVGAIQVRLVHFLQKH